MSRSYSALNDLIRFSQLISGLAAREVDRDWALSEVQRSVDILHVRADHIQTRLDKVDAFTEGIATKELRSSGMTAILALRDVVEEADAVLASDEPIVGLSSETMQVALSEARRHVYRYLDETSLLEERTLSYQAEKVLRLNNSIYVFLAVTTLAALFGLAQLRNEVVARKEREQAERRAEHLAYFDPLTGLGNRVHFKEQVEKGLRSGNSGAMILIDVDGFKDINERHGHIFGDAVLKQIGRSIRSESQANNGIAARFGADEFAVYMSTDNTSFLNNFCHSLLHDCSRAVQIGGFRLKPSVSIGMATTSQLTFAGRSSYDDLVRVADFALSAARSSGTGQATLYDSDLEAQFKERRAMMKELPRAIRNGDLEVFLQPKVDLATEAVRGFEALVRWRRDGRIVPPGEFIGVAEECGRVVDLDRYVLARAVEVVASWNRRYRTEFSVSVNLSALHFHGEPDLSFVSAALDESSLLPSLLTLEITESVQLSNWEVVGKTLTEMKKNGCRISIDDFGTGYSSLAYLTTIPADELKIDRSLVANVDNSGEATCILDAVLDLARSLKLEVVVEGVERESQCEQLIELGCEIGQGFLFGKPQPINEALADATFRSFPENVPKVV